MREPYRKGVASRPGPESCLVSRKAGHEALTGVRAGRAIEPRNGAYFRGPTWSRNAEGNRMGVDSARRPSPCAVEDPGHAWKLHAREPGDPSGARCVKPAGRRENAMSDESFMHAAGESHDCVVPATAPNKDRQGLAEGPEGRRSIMEIPRHGPMLDTVPKNRVH
jgi:hypothetical protein